LISGLLEIFTTTQGWIELLTLIFLELVLGIDNLVFIAITTDRLPKNKQHIGRRLGLSAAMVMRCILLCCIVWLMSFNKVLFTLPFGFVDGTTPVNIRDLIFLLGGIYLIYKGITEMKEAVSAPEYGDDGEVIEKKNIGLPHAVALIMVMDIVFSLDSVITAAGLSGHILIMCVAVIFAVLIMIIFADQIAGFINNNPEIKIVALAFIFLVGVMLFMEGLYIEEIGGIPLNTILYCMMAFGLVVSLLIMLRRHNYDKAAAESAKTDIASTNNEEQAQE
jgi:predicted tellurium resistance membrane protein TerC